MQVPQWAKLGGLAALLVADIALVVAVLRPTTDPFQPEEPVTRPTTTTSTPTTSAPTTSTSNARTTVGAMAVVSEEVAYRAAPAGCGVKSPGLQKSTDGGRTWKAVEVAGLGSIVRIEFTSAASGYVIGTTGDCSLKVLRTSSAGAQWASPESAADFWSPLPSDPKAVNGVGGKKRTPCTTGEVLQIARVTDENAFALCTNGEVRETRDAGATWSSAVKVAGATALTVDKGQQTRLVLAGRESGCTGTRVWTFTPQGQQATPSACVPMAGAQRVAAFDAGGGSVWLTVGDKTWRGSGALTSWSEG